jgi:membrane-bound lytic murein transglycosylase D
MFVSSKNQAIVLLRLSIPIFLIFNLFITGKSTLAQQSSTGKEIIERRLQSISSDIKLPYSDTISGIIKQNIHSRESSFMINSYYQLKEFTEQELRKRNMPLALSALPMAISGMNPLYSTKTNAAGLWGLQAHAALRYGLEATHDIEPRFDYYSATPAALSYLQFLYDEYNNWWSAIIAYTFSPLSFEQMKEKDSKGNADPLMILKKSPSEYRNFVASFIYCNYLIHYYNEHQIKITPIGEERTMNLSIKQTVKIEHIVEKTGITEQEIRELNPVYVSYRIVPSEVYSFVLPFQAGLEFLRWEDSLYIWAVTPPIKEKPKPSETTAGTITYTVRSGDNLGSIAARHGVSVSSIKAWNNLKSDLIHPGQKLIINSGKAPTTVSTQNTTQQKTNNGENKTQTSVSNDGYITYTVKQGDSLWSISQKFAGVSDEDIKKLNNLSGNTIHPGQVLKIKRK